MPKTMLVIGHVWPEPTSSAAGWRIIHLLKLFLNKGYIIHFASAASKSEYSYPLEKLGISEQQIRLNDSNFDLYIRQLDPQFVMFDRFMVEEQYSWRVQQACPLAIRILDTEDLHFLRLARQEAFKKNIPFSNDLLYSDLTKRELAAIYRSDLSLIISNFEYDLLTQHFLIPKNILAYLPFHIENQQYENPTSFSERNNFVFIGNFIHEPNWRTVLELKRLWPQIRKVIPKAELHIYGAYPTQKVFQLNQPKEGFIIKGRAEDAVDTLKKYKLLLAPIPFGAGLKGKFVDALFAGTPNICSQIAAEGFNNDLWNGHITTNDADFIEKAILLYQNQTLWIKAQQQAKPLFELWNNEAHEEYCMSEIDKIANNLQTHRNHNFVGNILWTNQFQSTKYMSLWIEEKNKK